MGITGANEAPAGANAVARFVLLAEFGWVILGGTVGTLARYALNRLIGEVAGVPLGILVINVSGAFVLGVLLESLALRGSDTGGSRRLRLLLGTGVIGGFTTYSLLAADIAAMLLHGYLLLGAAYGIVTVVAGVLASWAGVIGARAFRGRVQDE
ncbi:CrcB family protein [Leucobacter insecticola]|uniref:Fluoride-specific ion channel FluC n=1 Tax=Leucobacter insecticola TaxID=2714934 RepID=A0A6G8FJ11_9MICO|nr:CrcB family protein [Leucobacter insecticola]QIM16440.1 CrcB family protein [Leucobacter insecticola]